jgi:hypothetical protein
VRYRERPAVVDAHQWILRASPPPAPGSVLRQRAWRNGWQLRTSDGWKDVALGDWLVCSVMGGWVIIPPDEFLLLYESDTMGEFAGDDDIFVPKALPEPEES